MLLPFKNHEEGLKAFTYAVTTYISEPVLKHFAEALATVIADKECEPKQTKPLGIIPAWRSYDAVRPLIFMKKAVMTTNKLALKGVVEKCFIKYMQVCFFSVLYPTAMRVKYVPPKMHTPGNVDCNCNDCCDNAMQVLHSTFSF